MLPAKAFYLIRHGETYANIDKVSAGGGMESDLTENGINQAKALAAVINTLDIKPSRIYHSPMRRATDTATYINETLGLPMTRLDDFEEHRFGEWEGLHWDEVLPNVRANVRPADGENRDDFAVRIKRVLGNTLEQHQGDAPPMFVAHGGTFWGIMDGHKWAYEGNIKNCHLHYFDPEPTHGHFPWKVCQFDVKEGSLKRQTASFCPRAWPHQTQHK